MCGTIQLSRFIRGFLSVLLMRVGLILGVLCYSFGAHELVRSTREEGIGQGMDIF